MAGVLVTAGLLDRRDWLFHLGSHLLSRHGRLAGAHRDRGGAPFLKDLYERTHEMVHLGVREGSEVVHVAKVTGYGAW